MVASILGLLALVLGFTFNLAASRHDTRILTVLDESNAIGTTYLRARLLPEPQQSRICELLREYVDVRIRGIQDRKVAQAITRSEELHELLWSQAATAVGQHHDSIITGLFVQSLNEVIDLHAKRIHAGIRARIPFVIWVGLIALAVLSMLSVGYQAGLSTTRRSPAMLALIASFIVVIYLIADLDRPGEGLFQVGQDALFDVQKSMQSKGAAPPRSDHN
jgi:hypothetical protein